MSDNPYRSSDLGHPLRNETRNMPWSWQLVAYAVFTIFANGVVSLMITTFLFIPLNIVLHVIGGAEFGPQSYGQFGMVVFELALVALAIAVTTGLLWMRNKFPGDILFVAATLTLLSSMIYQFANWNTASFLSLLIVLAISLAASIATVRRVQKYAAEKYAAPRGR